MKFIPPVDVYIDEKTKKKLNKLGRSNKVIKNQAERFIQEVEEGKMLPSRHYGHMFDNVWKARLNQQYRIGFCICDPEEEITSINIIEVDNHDEFYALLDP